MKIKKHEIGFASLCYHYIRDKENSPKAFRKILGISIKEFIKQIKELKRNYDFINLKDVYDYYYKSQPLKINRPGILLTFDDGISDHLEVSQILKKAKIKAVFFIPTCILREKLPANPLIIHYALSVYRINKFLLLIDEALDKLKIADNFNIKYNKEKGPWHAISEIKKFFKFDLTHVKARKILVFIYKKHLLKDYPDIFEYMHLRKEDLNEIIKCGHYIGSHTYSHISLSSPEISVEDYKNEIDEPIKYLNKLFAFKIKALSYPFGITNNSKILHLMKKDKNYQLAFTTQPMLNTKSTNPLLIGRYSPSSNENSKVLLENLNNIINK